MSDLLLISSFSDWQEFVQPHPTPFTVLLFLSPLCGGCVQYKPIGIEFIKQWRKTPAVTSLRFAVIDVSAAMRSESQMQPILAHYGIHSIPTVLLVRSSEGSFPTLIAPLQHRNTVPIESWIQKQFYPGKSLTQMVGVAAVYETKKWIFENQSVFQQPYLSSLLQHFENKYLDEYELVSWIPNLYRHHQKALAALANRLLQAQTNPQWDSWIQKLKTGEETTTFQESSLPSNPEIRKLLIKEFYHFLLKRHKKHKKNKNQKKDSIKQ